MKLELPSDFTKPEYILDIETIEMFLSQIDEEMAAKFESNNIVQISEKMACLMEYRPAVNDMYASAKYYLNIMRKEAYSKVLDQFTSKDPEVQARYKCFTSASVLKEYTKTLSADFEWLYDKCERVNKSLTHYLDELRSLLSKEKELQRQMK